MIIWSCRRAGTSYAPARRTSFKTNAFLLTEQRDCKKCLEKVVHRVDSGRTLTEWKVAATFGMFRARGRGRPRFLLLSSGLPSSIFDLSSPTFAFRISAFPAKSENVSHFWPVLGSVLLESWILAGEGRPVAHFSAPVAKEPAEIPKELAPGI